jgi:putative Mg2+ transporter-C (MgtC) family protein
MSLSLQWSDIALRLGLMVLVGVVIGFNRAEHGKAAGMRTTVLVGLAASVAMLQVNLLLPTSGRSSDSFVMNDLMRLPLGILTGVGFIGAGAILRRGNIVIGVTTAATLWLVTVIGLCIGGGQIVLGLAATVLGLFALWVLKWIEQRLRQEYRGRLLIELEENALGETDIRRRIGEAGLSIEESSVIWDGTRKHRTLVFVVRHIRRESETKIPAIVGELEHERGVISLRWRGRF